MNQRLEALFKRQLLHQNTVEEKAELLMLMAEPAHEEQVKKLLLTYWEGFDAEADGTGNIFQPGQGQEILGKLLEEHVYPAKELTRSVKLWPRWAGIAAAVTAITLGVWIYTSRQAHTPEQQLVSEFQDIAPGKNTAMLSVAGGNTVQLSDAKTGVVMKGDQVTYNDNSVILNAGGNLLDSKTSKSVAELEMTLQTPRGGTYNITLSDGTEVTLNADSKLIYPASFAGSGERRVKVEGEVYFQVAKNKQRPFRVQTKGQVTEVLGTQFNINAYADEGGVKTTLIEGSVKVSSLKGSAARQSQVLKAGQQSILSPDHSLKVKEVDIASIIDWKNNEFYLDKMDFKLAMRKIARWYNIEVIYGSAVPQDLEAGGWIQRSRNLSDVLKAMEIAGQVHFKIEGRKLYVN